MYKVNEEKDVASHGNEASAPLHSLGLTSGWRDPVIIVSILRFLASSPAVYPIGQLGGGSCSRRVIRMEVPEHVGEILHSGSVS